jgi:hypothetical protein
MLPEKHDRWGLRRRFSSRMRVGLTPEVGGRSSPSEPPTCCPWSRALAGSVIREDTSWRRGDLRSRGRRGRETCAEHSGHSTAANIGKTDQPAGGGPRRIAILGGNGGFVDAGEDEETAELNERSQFRLGMRGKRKRLSGIHFGPHFKTNLALDNVARWRPGGRAFRPGDRLLKTAEALRNFLFMRL